MECPECGQEFHWDLGECPRCGWNGTAASQAPWSSDEQRGSAEQGSSIGRGPSLLTRVKDRIVRLFR